MNTKFKFTFEKTSKKHKCPSCGKKSYTRMHHVDTKEFLPDEYGICDRVNSCKYQRTPDSNIIKGFKEKKETLNTSFRPTYYYEDIPDFIDPNVFQTSLQGYENNHLVKFLYNRYGANRVNKAIDMYNIGTSNKYNGGVVFWQVCKAGYVRGGSIMAYDYKTGNRIKEDWAVTYVHSVLKLKHFTYGRCLYGEHLLANNPKHIGIVESEKTAIIMSIEKPETTWLATSGKVNFKSELLSSLKPFSSKVEIIAHPDKGGFEKWNDAAKEIRGEVQIKVSDFLEKEEYEDGCDIADVVLYKRSQS